MFLGGSFAEFRRWKDLPVHKKFLRLAVQIGWPVLSGCALYPFFKVKGMEEHFVDKIWQLIYGPLIVGIVVSGWYLLPAMLWQMKAGIQEDWIRDVRKDKKVDDVLELGANFKDQGVAMIDLQDDEESDTENEVVPPNTEAKLMGGDKEEDVEAHQDSVELGN